MDNCFRENKNKYVLGYLHFLVQVGIFNEITVSYLPVGHTHEDIDQFFSRVSKYMNTHNAITNNEFKECIKQSYVPIPSVTIIDKVANIQKYMIDEDWLSDIEGYECNV